MDPNAVLAALRAAIDLYENDPVEHHIEIYTTIPTIIDMIKSLDEWMSHGNFPPDEWKCPICHG